MADIFISYSRRDRALAGNLALLLAAEGYEVFWDHRLRAGQQWRKSLQREIEAATITLVLWSKHSVHSEFVQWEADLAIENKSYLPIVLTAGQESVRPDARFLHSHIGELDVAVLESKSPNIDQLLAALDEWSGAPSADELIRRRSDDAWNRKWYRRMTRFGDAYFHLNGAQVIAPFVILAVAFGLLWVSRETSMITLRGQHASDVGQIATLTETGSYNALLIAALRTKTLPSPPRPHFSSIDSSPEIARSGRSHLVYVLSCPYSSTCTRVPVGVFSGDQNPMTALLGERTSETTDYGVFVGLDGSQYVGEWYCGRSYGYGRWVRNGAISEGYWQGDDQVSQRNADLTRLTTRGQTELPSSMESFRAVMAPFEAGVPPVAC